MGFWRVTRSAAVEQAANDVFAPPKRFGSNSPKHNHDFGKIGAGDEIRTHDIYLGKVTLYP